MRIKPYKLIFLAVLLVALFASCSGNKTSETETTHPTTSGSTGNVKKPTSLENQALRRGNTPSRLLRDRTLALRRAVPCRVP